MAEAVGTAVAIGIILVILALALWVTRGLRPMSGQEVYFFAGEPRFCSWCGRRLRTTRLRVPGGVRVVIRCQDPAHESFGWIEPNEGES